MAQRDVSMVFADMDGTFLATDKSVPPENVRALDRLADADIPFVPCTGRSVKGVPPSLLAHPATRYAVGSNGAVVFDVAAQVPLRVAAMDKERVLALFELVSAWDLACTFDVFADGEIYAERVRYDAMGSFGIDEPTLAMLRRIRQPVDESVAQILGRVQQVEKVTCFWCGERDCAGLAEAICTVGGLSSAHGHPKNFEMQAEGVSKGSALVWLCAHAGREAATTVAFGDEANDVSLLQAAGTGVAMANATPEVLRAADVVTGSNDEGGVAQYLERLLGA